MSSKSRSCRTHGSSGQLRPGITFFDYGCGQGTDITGLRNLGYAADGWDPVHRPDGGKTMADVVNLGYVLNVIEDPAERLATLVDAFGHTRRLLVVSALIRQTVDTETAATFRDGVLTKRNTFQKYFDQPELQQYLEDALETTVVPVSLGIANDAGHGPTAREFRERLERHGLNPTLNRRRNASTR